MAPVCDDGRDDRQYGRREAVEAERFHGVSRGVAEVVREQADDGRPADAPERVPEKERAPRHASRAGQPGGPHAQAEDEAAEEHGLRAVSFEERLPRLEHLAALAMEAAGTFERPAPALAPD